MILPGLRHPGEVCVQLAMVLIFFLKVGGSHDPT
jgi:hypothetical protein